MQLKYRRILYALLTIILIASISYAKVGVKFNKPAVDVNNPNMVATAKASQEVSPVKTTGEPGFLGVYESNGTDSNVYGVKGPSNITTNIIELPPDTLPTNGQTKVYGTPVVRSASGNLPAHTEIPFTYGTVGGGGSITITEVLTEPDMTLMTEGQAVVCRADGDFYYKGPLGGYHIAGTYIADPDTTNPVITITTPATDGTWVNSTTYTALQGTSSDNVAVLMVGWCLDGTSYAPTNVTGTTTWTVSSITLVEGLNTIYVVASDSSNQGYTTRTINVDTVQPVIVAGTDSTHNGSATVTGTCVLTEINRPGTPVTFTATNCTPASGSMTGTYPNFSTPALTPTGTGNIVITYAALDLAGNSATGTDLSQTFTYNGSGGTTYYLGFNNINTTTMTTAAPANQNSGTVEVMALKPITIPAGATIKNIWVWYKTPDEMIPYEVGVYTYSTLGGTGTRVAGASVVPVASTWEESGALVGTTYFATDTTVYIETGWSGNATSPPGIGRTNGGAEYTKAYGYGTTTINSLTTSAYTYAIILEYTL